MKGKTTCLSLVLLLSILFLAGLLPTVVLADEFQENLERIENKPRSERDQLEKNARRYQKMSAEEKKRYRELHQTIQGNKEYQSIFQTYTSWLKTISPWQREILSEPQSASRRVEVARSFLKEAEELDEIREILKQSEPQKRPALSAEEISKILNPLVPKLELTSTRQGTYDKLAQSTETEEIQERNVKVLKWALEQHLRALKEGDKNLLLFKPGVVQEMIEQIPEEHKIRTRLETANPERRQREILFQELRKALEIHFRNLKGHSPSMDELAPVYRQLPRETQLEVSTHHRIARRLLEVYWLNPDLGEIHRLQLEFRPGKRGRKTPGKKRRAPEQG